MPQLAVGEKAVTRNPSEFSRLFNQHQGLIFRTAYRITGNASDAEDVLQTVFLRLMGRREETAGLQNEESYFRRAAVNAAVDVIRKRRAETPADEDRHSARELNDAWELRDCLRRAFARLTPRAAEIFALRHYEDFSHKQIAEALHISQVLVAVTLHRTRRQLQKEIHQCWGGRHERA